MNIHKLPKNIEISRQNYRCIVNIRNHAPTFAKMNVCTDISTGRISNKMVRVSSVPTSQNLLLYRASAR